MRRFERRRVERLQRIATVIGLSFALGALADAMLTWRLYGSNPGTPVEVVMTAADPEPAHDPSEPRAVQRPGENGERPPVATTGVDRKSGRERV